MTKQSPATEPFSPICQSVDFLSLSTLHTRSSRAGTMCSYRFSDWKWTPRPNVKLVMYRLSAPV
ncbi:hypothetical protein [Streptomyces sp. 061-3]|uniref:hypothetical protein n=1 Tax=Streptomyces sp. 061-3 TaxID=2789268 RepID=UPI00397F4413